MTISANTLFHFTDSIDKLIGILKNEFKPQYSSEDPLSEYFYEESDNSDIPFELPGIIGKCGGSRFFPPIGWVVPMVCFCDLPLSSVKEHMNVYGEYAIGMSKEWGLGKGLNPVIYLTKKSQLAYCLHEVENKSGNELFSEVEAYIKPYKEPGSNRLFYNEREWGYVPKPEHGEDILFKIAVHSRPINFTEVNQHVGEKYKLSFNPVDIKYILIKNDDERLKIINAIEDAKSKYDSDIVKVLTSRILSSKQVLEDF